MTLLVAVLFVFLYPPYYAWSVLDEPMVIPEAQGMTLREFYQDRRAAYEEAWEIYGHELYESENKIEKFIADKIYDFGEWALGSPVCGPSDILLLPGYAGLLPAIQTIEVLRSDDVSSDRIRDIWWENVEYGLWSFIAVPRGGLYPMVCRPRPVIYPEQAISGN
jgi:hypothetical protein